MSILEIILMIAIGIGVAVWGTIIVVKAVKKRKNPKKDEDDEIDV